METNILKETRGAKLTEVDNSTLQLAIWKDGGWVIQVCDINDITKRNSLEAQYESIEEENNMVDFLTQNIL